MPHPLPASSQKGKCLGHHHIKREVNEDDPEYSFFLKHLRPDARGRSYVLLIPSGSGSGSRRRNSCNPTIHLRYEAEEVDEKKKMKKKEISRKKKITTMNDEMSISDSTQINLLHPLHPSIDPDYCNFLHRLKLLRDGSMLLDSNVTVGNANAKEEEEEDESTPAEFVVEDEEKEYDDDDHFLTKIEVEQHKDFLMTKIEEEDDQDQKEGDDSQQESYSPPRTQTCSNISSGSPSLHQAVGVLVSPSFHTRLLNSINRPYDQREYHFLLKSATARKPVVKYKHLKTRDVPYETANLGSSYFDHFPDLHEKFKSADRYQRLMLLRGFFFWLKNLEHEGAYKPWISTP